jgi:hypothetical protein
VDSKIRDKDAFTEDTTSITHDNDLPLVDNVVRLKSKCMTCPNSLGMVHTKESLTVDAEDRLRENNISFADQPFNVYREQLSSQYHGLALWDPKPVENLHKQPVSIGDVGYLDDGAFMRIFNVTLPWDDPSNGLLGKPERYERIELSYFGNVRESEIREGVYHTPHVSKVDNVRADRYEE